MAAVTSCRDLLWRCVNCKEQMIKCQQSHNDIYRHTCEKCIGKVKMAIETSTTAAGKNKSGNKIIHRPLSLPHPPGCTGKCNMCLYFNQRFGSR
jgi:hypothetical protein